MRKTIKILFILTMTLMLYCPRVQGQTEKVIKTINKEGFWIPYTLWLESDDDMNGFAKSIHDKSIPNILNTRKSIAEDKKRAQEILAAKEEILGKKGTKAGKKQDEILAKYFQDINVAKQIFERAEQVDKRCDYLMNLIDEEAAHRTPPVMPSGKLTGFSYSCGNAFAGFHEEITLKKEGGKGLLKSEEKRMRYSLDDEEEKEAETIEVADSVFERVRDIVEEGMLYDVSKDYYPDYRITDASNWTMSISFEGGSIFTGGYATGPDHHDTLNKVLIYLDTIYKEATGPKKEGD